MPIITQTELDKLRNKRGVYSNLKKPTEVLKVLVVRIIETAFREYVRSHKGKHITKKLEDESWERFSVILQKYL